MLPILQCILLLLFNLRLRFCLVLFDVFLNETFQIPSLISPIIQKHIALPSCVRKKHTSKKNRNMYSGFIYTAQSVLLSVHSDLPAAAAHDAYTRTQHRRCDNAQYS